MADNTSSQRRIVLFGRELTKTDLEREARWLRETGHDYAASLMEKLWDDLHEVGAIEVGTNPANLSEHSFRD